MVERFLKLQTYVDNAVQDMYAEKFSFGALKPGVQLSSADAVVLRQV